MAISGGMRFLGTPSVDSSVRSPVPSSWRLFPAGKGRPCRTTAQPWSRTVGVTHLRGFHPGIPGRRARLHLGGERDG